MTSSGFATGTRCTKLAKACQVELGLRILPPAGRVAISTGAQGDELRVIWDVELGRAVIGSSAVRPGQIDLKDDRETAILFELVNLIA
jgi:hypothetical protein